MPVQPYLSVARMVKLKIPSVVGVPERMPSVESVRPGGRLPNSTVKT